MLYHATLSTSLGNVLLCAVPQGLCGLFFTEHTSPVSLSSGRVPNPAAGLLNGKPISRLRVATATSVRQADLNTQAAFGIDNTLTVQTPQTPAKVLAHFQQAHNELHAYASGATAAFQVPLFFSEGTDFQQSVWRAMLRIPFGQVVSYGELAHWAGRGSGYGRAVGAAVGRNPLSVIVPCHRVVASNRQLNGYSGGLDRKLRLLQHEGVALVS